MSKHKASRAEALFTLDAALRARRRQAALADSTAATPPTAAAVPPPAVDVEAWRPVVYVEAWRPVVGAEGIYEVSDAGRVRRLPYVHAATKQPVAGTVLVPFKAGGPANPTLSVKPCVNGKPRCTSVAALVLRAFRGPAPAGHEPAHINGNNSDDRLTNLAWMTRSDKQKISHSKERMSNMPTPSAATLSAPQPLRDAAIRQMAEIDAKLGPVTRPSTVIERHAAADQPRAATPKEMREICAKLEEVYDDGKYLKDYSDMRIGVELNLPWATVAKIREEAFGPLQDPAVDALRADMDKLRASIKAADVKIEALHTAWQALVEDTTIRRDALTALYQRLALLEQARTGRVA